MAKTHLRTRTAGTDRSPQLRYIRALNCDAGRLWELVTAPELLSEWLGTTFLSDEYGRFTVTIGLGKHQTGFVTACVPPHYFQLSWDDPPNPPSTVLVDVLAGRRDTYLIVTHGGISPERLDAYNSLWTARLRRLAQYVEARNSQEQLEPRVD